MQKTTPSAGRILIMAGFALSCFGLLLFLWLAFGGSTPLKPQGYRFDVAFKEAGQLAQEADVRISGVPVGRVVALETDKAQGTTDATIELEPRYAPLPRDSRAILRQKTLLGETYLEISPGNRRNGTVPEGGALAPGQVSPTVELDEILRALDPATRERLQTYIQQNAIAGRGRGRDISDALGNLAPFAEDARKLLTILDQEAPTVRQVVRDTGEVFTALSERDGQLAGLVQSSDRVFETTAANARQLQDTFRALPTFQREAATTFRRLERFARTTDPLVDQLRPAAREFSPTFRDLQGLAPDLNRLFTDLDPLITASAKGLPATRRFLDDLRPFLGELDGPLRQLNPALGFLSTYTDELRAFFANVVAATQATTGTGKDRIHYLRTTNPLNPENLSAYQSRLPTNRTNPYRLPRTFDDELPGGLSSFETRQCDGGPVPQLASNVLTDAGLGALAKNIEQLAFSNAPTPAAPPCREAAKFQVGGKMTKYPQVAARPAR